MKWAIQYQSNLCKIDEYGRPVARKGFLMKDICTGTDGEAQRTLQTLEGILAGQINTDVVLDDGTKVPTTLDVMALLDKPVGDVRSLMPSTWNDQGTLATTFRDPSLGGLFPKQDANILLKNNR
jgi:hypothetical protein